MNSQRARLLVLAMAGLALLVPATLAEESDEVPEPDFVTDPFQAVRQRDVLPVRDPTFPGDAPPTSPSSHASGGKPQSGTVDPPTEDAARTDASSASASNPRAPSEIPAPAAALAALALAVAAQARVARGRR